MRQCTAVDSSCCPAVIGGVDGSVEFHYLNGVLDGTDGCEG